MHVELVKYWIRTSALLMTPFAPHSADHIWLAFLHEPQSIQLARWPDPGRTADRTLIEAGAYMRGTLKMIRDAETALLKKLQKGKKGKPDGPTFDPKSPKSVRVYVATRFPEWQEICVQAVREAYSEAEDRVDDVRARAVLTERGLIKDKRAMPFVQAFKVGSGVVVSNKIRRLGLTGLIGTACTETDARLWCQDCFQPKSVVLRVASLGRVLAVSETVAEPGRCGGVLGR